MDLRPGVSLITTLADKVIPQPECDTDMIGALMPCNHQAADSRMLLHLKHASENGHQKAVIRTVDTDVVILAISTLNDLALSELWISFGTKKSYQYIPIYQLSVLIGPDTSRALPPFHAFTGCDSTSQFFGIGKKTAWKVWKGFPELTKTLLAINNYPNSFPIESEHMAILERFVVLLYCESCPATRVNQARKALLSRCTILLINHNRHIYIHIAVLHFLENHLKP